MGKRRQLNNVFNLRVSTADWDNLFEWNEKQCHRINGMINKKFHISWTQWIWQRLKFNSDVKAKAIIMIPRFQVNTIRFKCIYFFRFELMHWKVFAIWKMFISHTIAFIILLTQPFVIIFRRLNLNCMNTKNFIFYWEIYAEQWTKAECDAMPRLNNFICIHKQTTVDLTFTKQRGKTATHHQPDE